MARRARAAGLLACLSVSELSGCAGGDWRAADPTGALFARSIAQIADYYIEPVSPSSLAIAGAARLSRLDKGISVAEEQSELRLQYEGHVAARYDEPESGDAAGWGQLIGRLIADARQASPTLQNLSENQIDKALFDGITGALDRFSRYVPPDAAREARNLRDGFGGIGATIERADGTVRIRSVIPQGAAARAGLLTDDAIVAIDGVPADGRPEGELVAALRGPVGSAVEITIRRKGALRHVRLQRIAIVIPTVMVTRQDRIAIARISSFNQHTADRLVAELVEAEQDMGAPLRGIVLDLRGNPGGLLEQAIRLAELFVSTGVIASTTGRHPASRQFFEATGTGSASDVPLVVLIDGASASASEIVAAALQDLGRAVVIGSASFGKGTVQTVLRLPNNGELALTWARLVTPSGYVLHQHGVVPSFCTSDLGEDESSFRRGVARIDAGEASPASSRARALLDDEGWRSLRLGCPTRRGAHAIDLRIALAILKSDTLYARAVRGMAPALAAADAPGTTSAEPVGLTATEGALSSGSRAP